VSEFSAMPRPPPPPLAAFVITEGRVQGGDTGSAASVSEST